jgi:beta-galactosidase
MGLSEVFGIREAAIRTREAVEMSVADPTHPAMSRLKAGDILRGAQFAESVELLSDGSARVLARLADGSAAITTSTYGKGQTLFIGSFLGLATTPGDTPNRRFLMGLLDWARVQRPFTTSLDGANAETPLEARMQAHGDGRLLFLINHAAAPVSATVTVQAPGDGEFAMQEILGSQTLRQRASNGVLTMTREIPAKQVEIWNITTDRATR